MLIVVGVLVVLAIPIVGSIVEHMAYSGDVLPGVRIDGASVAGRSDQSVLDEIARTAADLDRTPIHARAGTQTFTVDPALIGFMVDVNATAQRARTAGRHGNPFALVSDTVLRRFRNDEIPLVVHYDPNGFAGLLDGWATALDRGVVEGGLQFRGATVVPIEPHGGTGLVRDVAAARLRALLGSANRAELDLPVGAVAPQLDAAEVGAAATRARALLTAPYTILVGTKRVVLAPASLAGALETHVVGHSLQLGIDPDRLHLALGAAVGSFFVAPVDASFAITSTNAVHVIPSRDGQGLDLDAIAAAILAGNHTIVAPSRQVHPAHDTAWANHLGITHEVSSFTTYYPAGQPRVHNIHLAADVLNNTVVEPGQIFSLNDKLGERTAAKGYVKAPILIEDGFGQDYGGGVSQLTTTLYNAEFFGGYQDVTHTTHTFYISRYPMGREATVNYPAVDLKFKNDTTHGLLIRASYTDTSITVTFYGDNDGRVVHEQNRREFNMVAVTDQLVSCPATLEVDPTNICATLPAGQKVTAQGGEPGWDVSFDRVIDQPGRPEVRQHFSVHYPMLPNKVLVGTGATTPAAPASTTAQTSTPPATKPGTTP
jgi:vancomycin resistance protein YoaR